VDGHLYDTFLRSRDPSLHFVGAFVSLTHGELAVGKDAQPATEESDDKPVSLSKKELEEWAEIFIRKSKADRESETEN
jgi:hypothetical protein